MAVAALGLPGLPVAAWSTVQGLDGWVFLPLFLASLALGVAGPWLVVAGVRLVRLPRLID